MKKVLCIDANWDVATQMAMTYREEHVYPILGRSFMLIHRNGNQAERELVIATLENDEVILITGSGHGSADRFTGFFGEILFQSLDNHSLQTWFNGKIVHLLSCNTAQDLGVELVKNGCEAFLGYDNFVSFNDMSKDAVFSCDSEMLLSLASGFSAIASYNRALVMVDKAIDEAETVLEQTSLQFYKDSIRAPGMEVSIAIAPGTFGNPETRAV